MCIGPIASAQKGCGNVKHHLVKLRSVSLLCFPSMRSICTIWENSFPQNVPAAGGQEAGLIPTTKKHILRWIACTQATLMEIIPLKFENFTQTTSIFPALGSDGLDLPEICPQEYSFVSDIKFNLYTHSVKLMTSAALSVFYSDYMTHLDMFIYSYHRPNHTSFSVSELSWNMTTYTLHSSINRTKPKTVSKWIENQQNKQNLCKGIEKRRPCDPSKLFIPCWF